MSSKSIVVIIELNVHVSLFQVPLGVLPKNENKTKEMVEILIHLHQYVPQVVQKEVNDKNDTVYKEVTHRVMLGGDQLSQARARGALKIKSNSVNPSTRLQGFILTIEDWHAKQTLFEVIWKYHMSLKSASERGTLYQMRNFFGTV